MKLIANALLAGFLTFGLSGCIVVGGGDWKENREHWRERQEDNKRVISQLEIGDSRQSILEQLGAPDFSEAFDKNGDAFRVLYYRTQHEHSDGETSKDETTPLVFKNDKLTGWGMKALHGAH